MSLFKINLIITVIIKDLETNIEREEIFFRPLITMYQENSEKRLELIEVATDELLDTIDETLVDVEEIKSFKVKVTEE